tara:strand:- start:183 stop:446 length:264 start_codon:yes stop_codon:yes gene_type:complete
MPLYNYDCLECDSSFELRHSYKEKNVECIVCKSKNIKKNLSQRSQVTKKISFVDKKLGSEVENAIQEGRQDLNKQKSKIKNRTYIKK